MDWNALRAETPVTQHWAYFDHAAVAPMPAQSRQSLSDWAADITANGDAFWGQWSKTV